MAGPGGVRRLEGGNNFKAAHGDGEKKPQGPPPQWSKPPTPVFYEGTLVITGEEGA